jgi:hypothetical protein
LAAIIGALAPSTPFSVWNGVWQLLVSSTDFDHVGLRGVELQHHCLLNKTLTALNMEVLCGLLTPIRASENFDTTVTACWVAVVHGATRLCLGRGGGRLVHQDSGPEGFVDAAFSPICSLDSHHKVNCFQPKTGCDHWRTCSLCSWITGASLKANAINMSQ